MANKRLPYPPEVRVVWDERYREKHRQTIRLRARAWAEQKRRQAGTPQRQLARCEGNEKWQALGD